MSAIYVPNGAKKMVLFSLVPALSGRPARR